jgi:hypothetical protein
MPNKKTRIAVDILIISALLFSGLASLTFAQMPQTQTCEACGMMVTADSQTHLKVVDSTGSTHYVDCLKCALKLLKNFGELNITATCDWNGPNSIITINLKNFMNSTIVIPSTALYIDGGCTKNRVVYDQAAADALFANNGTSQYSTAIQNVTIPTNATVLTIPQAANLYAFTSSPDPTQSATPTTSPTTSSIPTSTTHPSASPTVTIPQISTPNPTIITTQTCEACGMDVAADAQAKYTIIDGNGLTHYAECYMCALNLIKHYDKLTITSYCDWYGPNYTVTVQSQNFGKEVTVTPSAAMFLNGGSCVINRVAYNQTAANALLLFGFSKYTLPEQHYDLPKETNVTTVAQAALTLTTNNNNQTPTVPLIIGVLAGIAIVSLSVVAYKKLKFK